MSLSRFAIVAGGIFLLAVTAHAQDADGVYHLTLKDHHFVPDNLTVPANSKVTIHLKNEDDTAEEFDSHDLKREKVVAA